MHLEVTFRNLRPREEVRRRATALYDKLERFLDPSAQGLLVVTVEHGASSVELTVTSVSGTHHAAEEDADLRTALDRVFHRMETRLRRDKEKRVDRWHKGMEKPEGFVRDDGDAEADADADTSPV